MTGRATFAFSCLVTLFVMTTLQPSTTFGQARGTPQPQRRPAAKPTPLTLRQVIESLSASRNSTRAEGLVAKVGVQFQATPAIVDILKQFGASPKLISMIPAPPAPAPPPAPPAPRIAGPLTIVCEPKDCMVVVADKYEGTTDQHRKTVVGLRPGETTVQVFAEGYAELARRISLEEGKPTEEKFSLERSMAARADIARALLLKAIASLGGLDGLIELGELEGTGSMQWRNSSGMVEQWTMTFNKRAGKDIAVTFKTAGGQCTASILAQTSKQECRGGLRNGGDKIAEQGTSLFLSYQLQDVLDALLPRTMIASEKSENRLESVDEKDSYVLTVGSDGLPADLIYRIGGSDQPIYVEYSNYLNLDKGRYPGRISIGRLNSPPAWVFTISNIRSRLGRRQ